MSETHEEADMVVGTVPTFSDVMDALVPDAYYEDAGETPEETPADVGEAGSGKPVRQDVAVTGEVSIRGKLKAVGGVFEKAYGAKQAGVNVLIIPKENEKDIPADHLGLSVRPVEKVEDALSILFGEWIKGADNNAG